MIEEQPLNYIGYIAPPVEEYSFAIPVYEFEDRFYFHEIDYSNFTILSFHLAECEIKEITFDGNSQYVKKGDPLTFVYKGEGTTVFSGDIDWIGFALRKIKEECKVPMSSLVEIEMFLSFSYKRKQVSNVMESYYEWRFADAKSSHNLLSENRITKIQNLHPLTSIEDYLRKTQLAKVSESPTDLVFHKQAFYQAVTSWRSQQLSAHYLTNDNLIKKVPEVRFDRLRPAKSNPLAWVVGTKQGKTPNILSALSLRLPENQVYIHHFRSDSEGGWVIFEMPKPQMEIDKEFNHSAIELAYAGEPTIALSMELENYNQFYQYCYELFHFKKRSFLGNVSSKEGDFLKLWRELTGQNMEVDAAKKIIAMLYENL